MAPRGGAAGSTLASGVFLPRHCWAFLGAYIVMRTGQERSRGEEILAFYDVAGYGLPLCLAYTSKGSW